MIKLRNPFKQKIPKQRESKLRRRRINENKIILKEMKRKGKSQRKAKENRLKNNKNIKRI